MSIITLLTDLGYKDNFVGVMKGIILGINPKVHIVDLCHEVEPQDITGAAFALKTAYKYFPKDTIHLVIIDPGVGSQRLPILVKTKDYYFIGPDNGVLSLALEEQEIESIIYLDNYEFHLRPVSNTFHARDIFAPVAVHLSKGISYQLFGKGIKDYKKIKLPKPIISSSSIVGEIIYMDRFGNLFTNISQDLRNKIKRPRIKIKDKLIRSIKSSYAQVKPNNLLAIWGSSGFLEIAVNLGSAKDKLIAKIGDKVEIIVDV
ncbi:MAG: SAM-dependent chlorinase/fluorinase [Candidatus Omnitrophica bacterium]|nr:SAM-dependent chlorinase/fluorinase [Candidatus Omnitrophota bacterium]